MWNPDLLLTKAVALRRQEAQRTGGDPYAPPAATHLYRGEGRVMPVHRLQAYLGGRLVTWGLRLQRFGEPQTLLR